MKNFTRTIRRTYGEHVASTLDKREIRLLHTREGIRPILVQHDGRWITFDYNRFSEEDPEACFPSGNEAIQAVVRYLAHEEVK